MRWTPRFRRRPRCESALRQRDRERPLWQELEAQNQNLEATITERTSEAVPFDLAAVCGEAVRLLEGRASGKGVGLRRETLAAPEARVVGDPLRLRQILVNLLDNAIKFTERGRVILMLDAGPRVESGLLPIRLAVRDSGVGIPAAQRSRIFQHFTQADSPRRESTAAPASVWPSAASSWD